MERSTDGAYSTGYCIACKERVNLSEVQLHRFPAKSAQRTQWITRLKDQNIIPEDWAWKEATRICGKHFLPTDYGHADSNKWRKLKNAPKKPRLNNAAVPSVFKKFVPRPTKFGSAAARVLNEIATDEKLPVVVAEEMQEATCEDQRNDHDPDTFHNLEELASQLSSLTIPANIQTIRQNEKISFLKLSLIEKPFVEYCISLDSSLSSTVWVKGEKVPLKDILGDKKSTSKTINSIKLLERVLGHLDIFDAQASLEKRLQKVIDEILDLD